MYGVKHKIRLLFVTDKCKEDGTPLTIKQDYNLSLHDQSTLGKHLVSWRGRPFTPEEKKGFNVLKLINVPCYINVVHRTSGENTYANVDGIMNLPQGLQAPAIPPGFVQEYDKNPSIDSTSPYFQPKEWQLDPPGSAFTQPQHEHPAQHVQQTVNQALQQPQNSGHHTQNLYSNGQPTPALQQQPQQQPIAVGGLEPDDDLPFSPYLKHIHIV